MALKDYSGASNSREIFQHLVGDTIKASFFYNERLYLVMSDDSSFWITAQTTSGFNMAGSISMLTDPKGYLTYGKESAEETRRLVGTCKAEVERKIAELKAFGVNV